MLAFKKASSHRTAFYYYIAVFWNVPLSLLLFTPVFSFQVASFFFFYIYTRYMRRRRKWDSMRQSPHKQSEKDLWIPMTSNPVSTKVWPPSPTRHIKNIPTPVLDASCLEIIFIPTKLSSARSHKDGFVQNRVVQGCLVEDRLSNA